MVSTSSHYIYIYCHVLQVMYIYNMRVGGGMVTRDFSKYFYICGKYFWLSWLCNTTTPPCREGQLIIPALKSVKFWSLAPHYYCAYYLWRRFMNVKSWCEMWDDVSTKMVQCSVPVLESSSAVAVPPSTTALSYRYPALLLQSVPRFLTVNTLSLSLKWNVIRSDLTTARTQPGHHHDEDNSFHSHRLNKYQVHSTQWTLDTGQLTRTSYIILYQN